jgi:ketosteroid isomerase-like protein
MSENLDLVRSIFAAWERGDFSSAGWIDPDIECVVADGPSPGSWTGLPALAGAWVDVLGVWEELRIEAEEYRELDGNRVFVVAQGSARGKASGISVGHEWTKGAAAFHIRDGKVTQVVIYLDRDHALADLGLEE